MERTRRSSRSRKNVTHFDPLCGENDRLLRIALKRSRLESKGLPTYEDAARPSSPPMLSLQDVPTIQPSASEFKDPISLWQSLTSIGLEYGAIKLRPPDGWKPPFCLNMETLQFPVREQKLHRLAFGKAFTFPSEQWSAKEFKKFGDIFKAEREYKMADNDDTMFPSPTMSISADQPSARLSPVNDSESKLCHPLAPLTPFVKHPVLIKNKNNVKKKTVTDWEIDYWKLIETQASPVSVFYGADIEVNETGSGFPDIRTLHDPTTGQSPTHDDVHTYEINKYYAEHPWNLLNLPRVDGSLLKTFHHIVPGVTCPWLYLGMLFSSFCWHTEDNYFAAANYQHFGDCKVWYVIPPNQATAMQRFMKDYVGYRRPADILHSLTVQISPNILVKNNIQVYRIVQSENEFVLLWPRTFHCGFNTGYNCNEACNVAPPIWLDWGRMAVDAYRHLRSMCIPYEQLIFMSAAGCRTITRIETLEKLIKAMSCLIMEDYQRRRQLELIQVPFIPSSLLSDFIIDYMRTLTQHKASQDDIKRLHNCFKQICTTSVSILNCTEESFITQVDALSRLPCTDCTVCQAACYQGFVACHHSSVSVCLSCACHSWNKLPCRGTCKDIVFIYRFPLYIQLRLLYLLIHQYMTVQRTSSCSMDHSQNDNNLIKRAKTTTTDALCLPSQLENEEFNCFQEECYIPEHIKKKLPDDLCHLPSFTDAIKFEQERGKPITKLGLFYGPFILNKSSSIKRKKAKNELNSSPINTAICLVSNICNDIISSIPIKNQRPIMSAIQFNSWMLGHELTLLQNDSLMNTSPDNLISYIQRLSCRYLFLAMKENEETTSSSDSQIQHTHTKKASVVST